MYAKDAQPTSPPRRLAAGRAQAPPSVPHPRPTISPPGP